MRYLYQRGQGAKRRVMHLCRFDQYGEPTMEPICGRSNGLRFDTTCNLPLGLPLCKRCSWVMRSRQNQPTFSVTS